VTFLLVIAVMILALLPLIVIALGFLGMFLTSDH
jgi:hypothetical protein